MGADRGVDVADGTVVRVVVADEDIQAGPEVGNQLTVDVEAVLSPQRDIGNTEIACLGAE